MGLFTTKDDRRRGGRGEISTSLDGPEAAVAEGFDDGVVLDELLRVGVGELDGAALTIEPRRETIFECDSLCEVFTYFACG